VAPGVLEAVFESSGEAMVLTDAERRIVRVNPAFTAITGYPEEEALGRTPSLLRSGRHGSGFYAAMWREIAAAGHWSGEVWNRRKNGEVYPGWLTVSRVRGRDGAAGGYVGLFSDISRIKEAEDRLVRQARHDPVTGLPNRAALPGALVAAIDGCHASGTRLGVLFVDLDGFKAVNDTLGHAAGDAVLSEVAARLAAAAAALSPSAAVFRQGGDEFVVLFPGGDDDDWSSAAAAMAESLVPPFVIGDSEIVLSATVGISRYPRDGADADDLIKKADTAMYSAKKERRGKARFYSEAQTLEASERLSIVSGIRLALARDEFVLHYQPLVDGRSGLAVGAEALIRWMRPGDGETAPARFVPVAEETGAVVRMGSWVLREACQRARWWMDSGRPVVVAVNVSPRQVTGGTLVDDVRAALESSGLPPDHLELEITEGVMIGNPEMAVRVLNEISDMGVRIALDDFGTGYSSLAYLRLLPVGLVKIDRSFVLNLPNPVDEAMLKAIVALADSLGKKVLAEGVETEGQRQALLSCGIHLMQGYLFGRPREDFAPGAAAR
jgi:diguanylate cyclase (GGDEF)-like protein/PAS domain S-box-containing protein